MTTDTRMGLKTYGNLIFSAWESLKADIRESCVSFGSANFIIGTHGWEIEMVHAETEEKMMTVLLGVNAPDQADISFMALASNAYGLLMGIRDIMRHEAEADGMKRIVKTNVPVELSIQIGKVAVTAAVIAHGSDA